MNLKEALKIILVDEHLGDYVYHVRDSARESERPEDAFEGNSWDHPRVKRFSAAVERLEEELKK